MHKVWLNYDEVHILCQHRPKLGWRARQYTNILRDRYKYKHDSTDRQTYGNKDHTSIWIGTTSDKNPIGVHIGKVIS